MAKSGNGHIWNISDGSALNRQNAGELVKSCANRCVVEKIQKTISIRISRKEILVYTLIKKNSILEKTI